MLRINARGVYYIFYEKGFAFIPVWCLIEGSVYLKNSISAKHYNIIKISENKIIVKITGKREREIGLVVPANFVYITKDKNCSIILEAELEKRKTLFQDLKLKFYKKGVYRQFPFFMK